MNNERCAPHTALRLSGGLERHMAEPGAHRYDRHAHDEYSVIVVTEGRKLLRVGRAERAVQTGQIVIVPPGMSHDCEPIGQTNWAHRCWYVSAELVADLVGVAEARSEPPAFQTVLDGPCLAGRLAGVHKRLSNPVSGPDDMEEADLQQLELLADAFAVAMQERAAAVRGQRRSEARARAYDSALRAGLSNKLDLDMLADLGGVTRFQVIRDLKAAFDMTPGIYLRDLRLRESKRMLRKGHALVEISQALGFADQSHFSRTFKTAYGMSPLRYQQAVTAAAAD
ncbi:MAG: AraC family transcriptional regulator [Pseudomonadota bacterium]